MSSENMTPEERKIKNEKIKQSLRETKKRRKNQVARVFELKIDESHLNKKQSEALAMIFVEAKWLRNHIVGLDNINDYSPSRHVNVKLRDGNFEKRVFRFLGSQMKQSVYSQVLSDLKGLSVSKMKGRNVGKLKFVKEVNSIDLKQSGTTYDIFPETSRARIQKIPGRVRVHGLQQLRGYELANAKIVRKPTGYYLLVTCYRGKSDEVDQYVKRSLLGVDFGVSTSLTLSNGESFHVYVEETERLKRLQKKLSRQKKGSHGYKKTVHKIRREHEKVCNKRDDRANKIVSHILKQAEFIFIQDEMIHSWKVRYGRTVHHSVLGRVKARLVRHSRVFVLPRSVATTKTCVCGVRRDMPLHVRVYECGVCGYVMGRDLHSAHQMINMGVSIFNTCGTQGFKASGDTSLLRSFLDDSGLLSYHLGVDADVSVKLEAAKSLVSR